MCVCVCESVRTRKRASVRLIEGMHVCADLCGGMLMRGWVMTESNGADQNGAWQEQRTGIGFAPSPNKTMQPLFTL